MYLPSNQSLKLLRLPQVLEMTGTSQSTWYALISQGEAPKPVKLSKNGRSVGWYSHEIQNYLANLERAGV